MKNLISCCTLPEACWHAAVKVGFTVQFINLLKRLRTLGLQFVSMCVSLCVWDRQWRARINLWIWMWAGALWVPVTAPAVNTDWHLNRRHSALFCFLLSLPCQTVRDLETPLTRSHLFNPLFLHLFLSFFHHRHLTILLLSLFILVFPPFSLMWLRVGGAQDRGKLV